VNIHDDQYKHALKRGRVNREKIDRPNVFVSLEKALPVLGALAIPGAEIGASQDVPNGRL
jgi:hypothetical protein